MDVELILNTRCFIRNVILELYVKFVNIEEGGSSLAIVSINLFQQQEVESPTTQLMPMFYARNTYVELTLTKDTNPKHETTTRLIKKKLRTKRKLKLMMIHSKSLSQKLIPTELEVSDFGIEGSNNIEGIQPDFTAYEPPTHMFNIDIHVEEIR
ncbi:hypothetical protein J1N35_010895 [Gossypium stocksii]|uniref:Uncharacterized protein n=1 Tax=Gossypium stocksii TaxID=47602 RepID=A0A9D4AB04_9ROSI|nr:hypothetical protein J1N35_010895 [Gossypium stocksii]